eukprot:gene11807-13031_t
MSVFEPSSPDSDLSSQQCLSPGSWDEDCEMTTSSSSRTSSSSSPSKTYSSGRGVSKTKRLKASARERRRRHVLNDALEALRRKVSSVNQNPQKLSKIEVLRLAIDYIAMMSYYLDATATSSSPLSDQSPHYVFDTGAATVASIGRLLPHSHEPAQFYVAQQCQGIVQPQQQHNGFVDNFRKENQSFQLNQSEFDVYLGGYGNI